MVFLRGVMLLVKKLFFVCLVRGCVLCLVVVSVCVIVCVWCMVYGGVQICVCEYSFCSPCLRQTVG